MRKISIIPSLILILMIGLIGCQNEKVESAVFNGLQITQSETGASIDYTNVPISQKLKIYVNTDADVCVLWPGGKRDIIKSKVDPTKDSINVYGDVVLNGPGASDDYRDYGLFGAKGLTTSGSPYTGYSTTYTFTTAGTYKLVVVLTKHSQSSTDFDQIRVEQTLVVK